MRWMLPSLLPVLILLSGAAFSAESGGSTRTIVFFGDSLTAGMGVEPEQAYPKLVEKKLQNLTPSVRVINAGSSGDTTRSGLSRVDWVLRKKPEYFVIALGANDMLRAVPPSETEKNLGALIEKAKNAGAKPILFGMRAAPNLGEKYVKEFESVFPRLARAKRIPFLPFFVSDVAGSPELNQSDGIHPSIEGQRRIAERVSHFLVPILSNSGAEP